MEKTSGSAGFMDRVKLDGLIVLSTCSRWLSGLGSPGVTSWHEGLSKEWDVYCSTRKWTNVQYTPQD